MAKCILAVLLLATFCNVALSTQNLTGRTGCFSSPNFPRNYPHNIRETYKITVSPGSRVNLTFLALSLESSSRCRYDHLRIREKDGSISRTLCGTNSSPGDILSKDNEIMLEFKSDGSVSSQGFFAVFVVTNSTAPAPSPSPARVDGGWCGFNWTACSASCGYGYRYGYRSCNCPPPMNGGRNCTGQSATTQTCYAGYCPTSSAVSSSSMPRPTPSPVPSCGGHYTSAKGSFASPGYPYQYPNNARCRFEIRVPPSKRIVLTFEYFQLENGYDRLKIKQMTSGSMVTVADLTGSGHVGRKFSSAENVFILEFTSDGSVTRQGFVAKYYTIPERPSPVNGSWCAWVPSTPCSVSCDYGSQTLERNCSCPSPSDGGRNCTGPSSRITPCYAGYCPTPSSSIPMPRPTPTPVPSCRPQHLNGSNGVVKSPGYPNQYQNNANCEYTITVQDGKRIKIQFSMFDVEQADSCRYDRLTIYDGHSMVEKSRMCGSGSKAFTSRGNKVFMRFTSDGSVTKRGFYGTYEAVDKSPGATVNARSCGIRRFQQSRVIGGTDAAKGAWPWQVGMYLSGRFICGGTLIAPNWILTASHCVVSGGTVGDASNFEIVVGDLHREINDTTERRHQVDLIIPHPNYSGRTINNDIALMKLTNPAMITDHVVTACIPEKSDAIAVGSECFITGWGKIQHPGGSHPMLQQAKLPVLNSSFCQSKIDKLGWGLTITKQMVCAGEVGSKKSGCHGDSGGPFVCPDRRGRFYLHGDVSWGSPECSTTQAYSVFARVTEFVDWIKTTLMDN